MCLRFITGWNTRGGRACAPLEAKNGMEPYLQLQMPPFATDLALTIRRQ